MIDRTLLRNILLLAACQGMLLCNGVTLIAVNGLVGRQLAPTPTLATLTITGYVIGAALLTLPASRFMRRFGRRAGFMLGAVLGICGGFQMLGRRLIDGVESGIDEMPGLGLLDCETVFAREKVTTQVQATVVSQAHGLLAGCSGLAVEGYEIHMGETERAAGVTPFTRLSRRNRAEVSIEEGAISQDGLVAGTYIHGIFDAPHFTRALLNTLRQRKGLAPIEGDPFDYRAFKNEQFDQLAAAMRQHLDMTAIYRIIERCELPACHEPCEEHA